MSYKWHDFILLECFFFTVKVTRKGQISGLRSVHDTREPALAELTNSTFKGPQTLHVTCQLSSAGGVATAEEAGTNPHDISPRGMRCQP